VGEMTIPGDLFTNHQLLQFYDPEGRTGTTANGLGRELRRSGINQVCQGKPIKTPEGLERLYIIRNHNKWVVVDDPKEVIKHLAEINKKKVAKY
jgi:hypothetical protein